MASRDIWSRTGSLQVRDLLASLLSSRLLMEPSEDPFYVSAPYLTDFPVFDNAFGQFQPLFQSRPEFGEQDRILFSQALIELSSRSPVRLIGVSGPNALPFMYATISGNNPNLSARLASQLHHEKGLLCPAFYLEGSMNFTYNGVYNRDEKISVYTPGTPQGSQKIGAAMLEFNRLWDKLTGSEIPRNP
jgi:hypothetical protein